MRKNTEADFYAQFPSGEPEDCWLWRGQLHRDGYGVFRLWGRQLLTHRIAYALFIGEIPAGLQVCHKCDVPSCVNPSHLFLGTQLDNIRDRLVKGRSFKPKGTLNPNCKINQQIADKMRSEYASGQGTLTSIGTKYGVSHHVVYTVVHNLRWTK